MKYAILISLCLLSSCSRLDLALDYAPRYLANTLDDSFNLSSERYKKIKEAIEKDVQGNKKELINEVIARVEVLQQLADKPQISKEDIADNFNEIKKLQLKAVKLFKASFSEVILGLSAKEFNHMKEYADERFKRADERLLDKDEFFEHSNKAFERTMNVLFDSVTDEQKKMYQTFLQDNYDFYKNQIEVRKNFLKQFELLLDKKPDLLAYTMDYYAGDSVVKSAEHIKKQELFFNNMNQLQLNVWNSTTVKQRAEFKATLSSIKEELKELIK